MRAVFLVSFLVLLSCSRPLTEGEKAFAHDLHGSSINTMAVTMVADVPLGAATFERKKRPRKTCRERIYPEPRNETVTVSPAAVVLWNTAHFSKTWYRKDFMKGYPERMDLSDAMLFAHEMTHIWQWQNRKLTGYSPLRAAQEHDPGGDPYLFDITSDRGFLDYGYEQQASIVEEFVCCSVLDPQAPRTDRLRDMIAEVMPTKGLLVPDEVRIPWKDAEIKGICRL